MEVAQLGKRAKNQYTSTSDEDVLSWLLSKTTATRDQFGIFECYVLEKQRGIDKMETGYCRFSHNGRKMMAHRFVFLCKNPHILDTSDVQVSHLCANRSCCRIDHLVNEDRKQNMARIGCLGYIRASNGTFYSACCHEPHCLKITDLSNFAAVTLIPQ